MLHTPQAIAAAPATVSHALPSWLPGLVHSRLPRRSSLADFHVQLLFCSAVRTWHSPHQSGCLGCCHPCQEWPCDQVQACTLHPVRWCPARPEGTTTAGVSAHAAVQSYHGRGIVHTAVRRRTAGPDGECTPRPCMRLHTVAAWGGMRLLPSRCNCLPSSQTSMHMHTALTPRPPHRSCKCGGAEVARGISSSSLLSSLSYSRLRATAPVRPVSLRSQGGAQSGAFFTVAA